MQLARRTRGARRRWGTSARSRRRGSAPQSPGSDRKTSEKSPRCVMPRRLGLVALVAANADALTVCGLDVPHARLSPTSRALDTMDWSGSFPFGERDLTPEWSGNDQMFYVVRRHAQPPHPCARPRPLYPARSCPNSSSTPAKRRASASNASTRARSRPLGAATCWTSARAGPHTTPTDGRGGGWRVWA